MAMPNKAAGKSIKLDQLILHRAGNPLLSQEKLSLISAASDAVVWQERRLISPFR
jgi:hypothetical protein